MTNEQTEDLQKTYQQKIDDQTGDESPEESLGVEQLPQTELDSTPGKTGEADDLESENAG